VNWKSAVVLIALASALGGFFYYDTYWLTPARDKAESTKGRLWTTLEPRDVEALTIKRRSDTVRLKRVEGGGWEMLEPVKTRGDRATADDVVTSLATLRRDREIDPNPTRLGDFGLDPVAAEVRLQVKGRKEPLVLLVGTKSPTGAWVYAKEDGKSAVMTVSEVVERDTGRPAADFRDKTVVAFDKKSVSAVDLEVGGARVSLLAEWQDLRDGAGASGVTDTDNGPVVGEREFEFDPVTVAASVTDRVRDHFTRDDQDVVRPALIGPACVEGTFQQHPCLADGLRRGNERRRSRRRSTDFSRHLPLRTRKR